MRNPLIHLARICWSAAAILTCLLSGCEPETIPAARVNAANLFSLRVNQLVDRGGGDIFPQTPGQNKYHVVVSDMNGRLVGYKELTANTSFVFEKPEWFAGDELMVTTVSKSPMHYTLVNTLRNVPVGSRWRMYPLEPVGPLSPQPVFYKSTLRLSNIPDGAVRLFSNDPSVLIVGEPKPGIDY